MKHLKAISVYKQDSSQSQVSKVSFQLKPTGDPGYSGEP